MSAASITIASSIAIRLRYLAGRVHDLGPRPLFELFCELVDGADPVSRFEAYSLLDADFIRANGGDVLPRTVWVVK